MPKTPSPPTPDPLAEARAAYARGDFRTTRERLQALLAGGELDGEQRAEAEDLLGRLRLDPVTVLAGLASLLLLLTVAWLTLRH